eukprot:scaffold1301_cov191-Pinguiococcus_pyrenoidosus.AAC.2
MPPAPPEEAKSKHAVGEGRATMALLILSLYALLALEQAQALEKRAQHAQKLRSFTPTPFDAARRRSRGYRSHHLEVLSHLGVSGLSLALQDRRRLTESDEFVVFRECGESLEESIEDGFADDGEWEGVLFDVCLAAEGEYRPESDSPVNISSAALRIMDAASNSTLGTTAVGYFLYSDAACEDFLDVLEEATLADSPENAFCDDSGIITTIENVTDFAFQDAWTTIVFDSDECDPPVYFLAWFLRSENSCSFSNPFSDLNGLPMGSSDRVLCEADKVTYTNYYGPASENASENCGICSCSASSPIIYPIEETCREDNGEFGYYVYLYDVYEDEGYLQRPLAEGRVTETHMQDFCPLPFIGSAAPSSAPTAEPSMMLSEAPTAAPSVLSAAPSAGPTTVPTFAPSSMPTLGPSQAPSDAPSGAPSLAPSGLPSGTPSRTPSSSPSGAPSSAPSAAPSGAPSASPSGAPTPAPSSAPSAAPLAATITIDFGDNIETLASAASKLRSIRSSILRALARGTAVSVEVEVEIILTETSSLQYTGPLTGRVIRQILDGVKAVRCSGIPMADCTVTQTSGQGRRLQEAALGFEVAVTIRNDTDLSSTTPLDDSGFVDALNMEVSGNNVSSVSSPTSTTEATARVTTDGSATAEELDEVLAAASDTDVVESEVESGTSVEVESVTTSSPESVGDDGDDSSGVSETIIIAVVVAAFALVAIGAASAYLVYFRAAPEEDTTKAEDFQEAWSSPQSRA